MKSRMTSVVPWNRALWLLVLLPQLFFGASSFAQNSGLTNILSSSTSDLQSALDGGGTVLLNFNGTITAPYSYYVSTDVVLDATTNSVTISGGNSTPIFQVAPGVTFVIRNLTISGGKNTGFNGANGIAGNPGADGTAGTSGTSVAGGAIWNQGTNLIINCSLLGNSVVGGSGGNGGAGGNNPYQAPGNGGKGGNGGNAFGGAIYNQNTLLLSNCTFSGNSALGGNGGIGGTNGVGQLTAYTGQGGSGGVAYGAALYSDTNTSVTILACTFASNSCAGGSSQAATDKPNSGNGQAGLAGARGFGGAIFNASTNMIVNCTFFGNLAVGGNGGNGGNASYATAGAGGNGGNASGGSLYNAKTGVLTVTNCTFVEGQVVGGTNGANGTGLSGGTPKMGTATGGNIANTNGGTLLLRSCILAYPINGSNVSGTIIDEGYNLSSDASPAFTASPKTNHNILNLYLDTLLNYGGPTATMRIESISPARGVVTNGAVPSYDQRGVIRPPSHSSIGAYEFGNLGYVVSGQVGTNFAGIPVFAQGTNNTTYPTQTDSEGKYIFPSLPPGTYLIFPSETNGFAFTPFNQTITVAAPGVSDVNFSATPAYVVGGTISNATTSVTLLIYANGSSTPFSQALSSATTGIYTFTNIPPGNYTILPSSSSYSFNPASLQLNVVNSLTNVNTLTNENFSAFPPTYAVSGRVADVNSAITLVASIGSGPDAFSISTLSDTSGNYIFANLPANTYTITPQPTNGYTYSPISLVVTVPPATNSQNFTATASPTYSLSGQISNLRQVTSVKAVSSTSTNTVSTDAGGNYKFASLPPASYTVSPQAMSGITFNPSSRNLSLSSSTGSQNFAAITTSHSSVSSGQVSGDQFSFTVSGTPNVVYRIQVSTNLAGPWIDLSTNTAGVDGSIAVTNSMTNYPALYFRAVTP